MTWNCSVLTWSSQPIEPVGSHRHYSLSGISGESTMVFRLRRVGIIGGIRAVTMSCYGGNSEAALVEMNVGSRRPGSLRRFPQRRFGVFGNLQPAGLLLAMAD
jgi:hypothetical protein